MSWLGQYCRALRRSARAADMSPASSWVRAEVRANHGSDAVALAPMLASARRSGAWSPVRISGTAKRRNRFDSSAGLRLCGGMVEGLDRPILAGPPARGRGVQLGGPRGSLALQVGDQICAQEFLDAVGIAPRSPVADSSEVWRSSPSSRLPASSRPDSSAASPDGTGSLMLITRRNSWMSSGSRGEDLSHQVVGDRALVAGELVEERVAVGGPGDRERGQPQAGGPTAGALVQRVDLPRREPEAGSLEQGGCLRG